MAKSTGVTLDKITVNQQIVSMRSIVQKVKINTINKLTREVKSLKVPKPGLPELQSEKRILKADRLIKELLQIKKATKDDVSKHALLNTKNTLDAERLDPNSSPETKALARLASNSLLVNSTEQFRTKYSQWMSTLPSLIDNLGVKVKQKKRKFVEVIPKAAVKNDDGKNNQATKHVQSTKIGAAVVPFYGEEKAGKMEKNTSSIKKTKSLPRTRTVHDDTEQNETVRSKKIEVSAKTISILKKTSKKQHLKPKATESNAMKVTRFSELLNESTVKLVDEVKVSTAKTADSFFVSNDGQSEYMSTVANKDEAVEQEATASHKYDKMRETFFNNFGRVPNRRELRSSEKHNLQSSVQSFKNTFTKEEDKKWSNKIKKNVQGSVKSKTVIMPVVLAEEGPVHPSWEAKRKQKEMISIGVFQGKKIKFD